MDIDVRCLVLLRTAHPNFTLFALRRLASLLCFALRLVSYMVGHENVLGIASGSYDTAPGLFYLSTDIDGLEPMCSMHDR